MIGQGRRDRTARAHSIGGAPRYVQQSRVPLFAVCVLFLLPVGVLRPYGVDDAVAGEKPPSRNPATKQNSEYLIGPGDVLEIMVWKEPTISRTVHVRLDGKISLPLVDDIQAANSTLLEVKRRITETLRGYLDSPTVYVILQESRSKRIYIVGKVSSPGEYPLQKDMTLLQAIATAGGFATWADTNDLVLIRKTPKGQVRSKVNYKRAVSGKDLGQNILLQPDDVLVVP